jgi:sec-independent protein translocase protein TatA
MPELIVIFVIALIVFGPRRLPDLGRSVGLAIGEFKRAASELHQSVEQEIERERRAEPAQAAVPHPGEGEPTPSERRSA